MTWNKGASNARVRVDKAAGLPYRRGPFQVIRTAAAGSGPRYEQGTLIEIMPKDLLGPTPEEVQLWLRFPAAAQRLVIPGVR